MKIKILIILCNLFILTNCSIGFSSRMNQLKPIKEYSTENTTINSSKVVNAKVTFINGETVNTKIQALKNINGSLDPSTITSYIAIYDNKGKRNFIKNSVIRKMIIIDYNHKERTFVNRSDYPNSLQELIYDGKIKWFIEYGNNLYDYSVQTVNYFINENGKEVKVGQFNSLKNKLKEITISKPHLSTQIDKMEYDTNSIINILSEHEK